MNTLTNMTIRKMARLPATSEKMVTQTMRVTKGENRMHKRAAKKLGMSFNSWAVLTLNGAAVRELQPQLKPKEQVTPNGTSIE